MEIDRVTTFVTFEELLPKRRERQRPLAQEHERDLGIPLERVPLDLRHQRRAPEELLIGHRVKKVGRRLDPRVQAGRLVEAVLEGGERRREDDL